jgi:peptidyl-Lys metalloendopeptidase
MRRFSFIIFASLALSTAAQAQVFQSCTKSEQVIVGKALGDSKRLALTAAANVGENAIYETWFGKFTSQNSELVRSNLKSIVSAIRTGSVTAVCDSVGPDGCEAGTFAWVYPDEPFEVHFCPQFFEMPSMTDYRPGAAKDENGTREGTVVHEISHFQRAASTDDNCYARDVCADMAIRSPQDAVENADSYQYFAEDVGYFYAADPKADINTASQEAN